MTTPTGGDAHTPRHARPDDGRAGVPTWIRVIAAVWMLALAAGAVVMLVGVSWTRLLSTAGVVMIVVGVITCRVRAAR